MGERESLDLKIEGGKLGEKVGREEERWREEDRRKEGDGQRLKRVASSQFWTSALNADLDVGRL